MNMVSVLILVPLISPQPFFTCWLHVFCHLRVGILFFNYINRTFPFCCCVCNYLLWYAQSMFWCWPCILDLANARYEFYFLDSLGSVNSNASYVWWFFLLNFMVLISISFLLLWIGPWALCWMLNRNVKSQYFFLVPSCKGNSIII